MNKLEYLFLLFSTFLILNGCENCSVKGVNVLGESLIAIPLAKCEIGIKLEEFDKEFEFYFEPDSYNTSCREFSLRIGYSSLKFKPNYEEYLFWDNHLYAYKAYFYLDSESNRELNLDKLNLKEFDRNIAIQSGYIDQNNNVYQVLIKHKISEVIEKKCSFSKFGSSS